MSWEVQEAGFSFLCDFTGSFSTVALYFLNETLSNSHILLGLQRNVL